MENTLNYGMRENRLAKSIGCSVDEAKELMAKYMQRYPAVAKFYTNVLKTLNEKGCVYTLLGRRRKFPDVDSSDRGRRNTAERQAINLEIQGTAADVVKMAMVQLDMLGLDERYGCKMVLQVHDEIVFECPEEHAEVVFEIIKRVMEHPLPLDLDVPLITSGSIEKNWEAAK